MDNRDKGKILLQMAEALMKGQDFKTNINGREVHVPIQFTKSNLPYFQLKTGKLILQNPKKRTLYAEFAKKGKLVAWLITNTGDWKLVTDQPLLTVYRAADSKKKAMITKALHQKMRELRPTHAN